MWCKMCKFITQNDDVCYLPRFRLQLLDTVYYDMWYFQHFVFELRAHAGQTDGQKAKCSLQNGCIIKVNKTRNHNDMITIILYNLYNNNYTLQCTSFSVILQLTTRMSQYINISPSPSVTMVCRLMMSHSLRSSLISPISYLIVFLCLLFLVSFLILTLTLSYENPRLA